MNMQKRTVYVMGISSISCIILYAVCIFFWKPCEGTTEYLYNVFVSNILLGLLGSSVVSGIVALIAYFQNRKDTLENYIFKYHELFSHCSIYSEKNQFVEKVSWYKVYVSLVKDLETIWADIGFLIDPMNNRGYLKKVADYYNDFILLTENHYRLLGENISDAAKRSLSEEIDKIVLSEKKIQKGVTIITIRVNRFTYRMEMVNKTINEIYGNRKMLKKYNFNKSLVTKEVFKVMDEEIEKYIRVMIKEMQSTGSTSVCIDVPEKVCKELCKADYISGYSKGKNRKRQVDCQFLLFHYFDLKNKCL